MEAPKNQKEILDFFNQGLSLLEENLCGLTENELNYIPSNGGWTIRQIVHHIADGDDLWKTAIKMALGNEEAEFCLNWYQTLSQIEWGKKWNYEKRSITKSLNLFKANREHIKELLEYAPNSWKRKIKFLERDGKIEVLPIGFILEMQAEHAIHHINRIIAIRKEITNKLANNSTQSHLNN